MKGKEKNWQSSLKNCAITLHTFLKTPYPIAALDGSRQKNIKYVETTQQSLNTWKNLKATEINGTDLRWQCCVTRHKRQCWYCVTVGSWRNYFCKEKHNVIVYSMTVLEDWNAWPNHLRLSKHVCLCGCTSALGVTGIENSIEQILLTDETDFCHILLPVFRSQWRSWACATHTQQSMLSWVANKHMIHFP